MKILIALLFSFSAFAARPCLTNQFCPTKKINSGIGCAVFKTGVDPLGNVTCRMMCYQISKVRTLCHKEQGHSFGRCENMVTENPQFDPDSPEACSRALSPKQAEFVFSL